MLCMDVDSLITFGFLRSQFNTLYYLARIQYALWIKEGLDLAHPFEGGTMFGFHKFHFDQTYPVFSGSGAAKFQGALDKLFGECLGSPILFRWRSYQSVEVAVTDMTHNTPF